MSLKLTNIPRIMRSHGWLNGARLLESWFSRPSGIAPAYGLSDFSTIRMDTWVLTFPRARQTYNQIMSERIWMNPPAQREIASMLRRKSLLSGTIQSFGNSGSQSVQILDTDYINYRLVGGSSYYNDDYYYYYCYSGLDDMTAALGRFVFRVLVAGSVIPLSGSRQSQIEVRDIGIYIRDSFDFNGDQFLGFWDDSDNSVSTVNFLSGTSVSNEDFRNWRNANRRGGDFLVFSDIKWTHLATPDTFVI